MAISATDSVTFAADLHARARALSATDPQLAYRLIVSAAEAAPDYAEAWYMLGCANGDLKLNHASVAAARRALQCSDVPADLHGRLLTNLGHRLYQMGRIEEAEHTTRLALNHDGGLALAWSNLGLILSFQELHDVALDAAQRGFGLEPTPATEVALALVLLFAGRLAEGLKHFEARFPYRLTRFEHYPYPRWDGEWGGQLLVVSEQGLGDTLSFSRFLDRASDLADVTFMVKPELVSLFRDLPYLKVIPEPSPFPEADAFCPVMSLPRALGLTDGQIRAIPPLSLSATEGMIVNGRAGAFKVGIAWAGADENDSNRYRSIPVELFLELLRVPNIQLYSLQQGSHTQEMHAIGSAGLIADLAPWITSAADTLGLMQQLDLVIACESFVAHLAGAAGLECWVLASRAGGNVQDWRIGRSGERAALWYPKHRVFHQGPDQRWEPVFERVIEALQERAGNDGK